MPSTKMQYVQLCLLAKLWYVAQTFPLPNNYARQLTTICTWFIWKGATFRVPITTVQRPKKEGGWDRPSIDFKCKTILYNKVQMTGSRDSSVLMELMCKWDLPSKLRNPPNIYQVPSTLPYLRQYAVEMAYVTPYSTDETRKNFNCAYMPCYCAWPKRLSELANHG